jgi:hypothetical protein
MTETGTNDLLPLSAAERMRRYRQRKRDGLIALNVEMRLTEVQALVEKGLLKAEARHNAGDILLALYRFLDANLEPVGGNRRASVTA